MPTVAKNEVFEATYGSGTAGLVGTLEVAIQDGANNVVVGPTAAGIIENVVDGIPTGTYTATLTAPGTTGQYSIVWSEDGLWDPVKVSPPEDLIVTLTGALTPIFPDGPGGTADMGPCSAWVTPEQIAEADCCDLSSLGSDLTPLELYAGAASQILWLLTGKRYSGLCTLTARPCNDDCSCWPFQRLAYPAGASRESRWIFTGVGGGWTDGNGGCGCGCLPRVLLSGYPVQEILEVKIDGVVVDPSAYRLDEQRYLVRRDGDFWPACQNRALDDTEDGTFSVSYTYGEGPPLGGAGAAVALSCELFSACTTGECSLPENTVRIVRQGLTFDKLSPVAEMLRMGATGIKAIDFFLAAIPNTSHPAIWSPDGPQYARPVGT